MKANEKSLSLAFSLLDRLIKSMAGVLPHLHSVKYATNSRASSKIWLTRKIQSQNRPKLLSGISAARMCCL